jgi:hypothetical protein
MRANKREVNGSTGYGIFLVKLENLALVSIDTDPLAPGHIGTWTCTRPA